VGIAAGLVAAFLVNSALRSMFYGSATRVDPVLALRQ
jgi:ribosomal protein S12 methylthiotransferase accessory factor YcaO